MSRTYPQLVIRAPFIGKQADLIKKKIQQLIGSIRPDLEVRFVAKLPRAVHTFFPTKNRVPKHLESNTVCATTCKDRGDTSMGIKKRQTATRFCEHGALKNT
jgi:hypothetical protein